MIPAPRTTPLHPNSPNLPVFGGMKGCQSSGWMKKLPATMNIASTASLMTTMIVLVRADSLTPITSSAVMTRTTSAAGRVKGAVVIPVGRTMPTSASSDTAVAPQPSATVEDASEYSRIRSHPMIQATSSPSVAYAYVYADPATGIMLASSA